MARVAAGEAAAVSLSAACGLAIAAHDGPRSHVLAGPVPAVRELIRQAGALGVTADVLDAGHALHTPAMTPCIAPLRSVLSQVRFGPPQRRLVSTVTARELTHGRRHRGAAVRSAHLPGPLPRRDSGGLGRRRPDRGRRRRRGTHRARPPRPVSRSPVCGWAVPRRGAPGRGHARGFPAADPGAACAAALLAAGAIPAGPARPSRASRHLAGLAGRREARPAASLPSEPEPEPVPAPRRDRFLETVSVFRPGAELIAEARICARTDPYLADYLLDGQPVLPPVIGLEAMAEAASALAGRAMRERAAGVAERSCPPRRRGDGRDPGRPARRGAGAGRRCGDGPAGPAGR